MLGWEQNSPAELPGAGRMHPLLRCYLPPRSRSCLCRDLFHASSPSCSSASHQRLRMLSFPREELSSYMTNLAVCAAALQPHGLWHYLMVPWTCCASPASQASSVLLLMGTGGTEALWTVLSFAEWADAASHETLPTGDSRTGADLSGASPLQRCPQQLISCLTNVSREHGGSWRRAPASELLCILAAVLPSSDTMCP